MSQTSASLTADMTIPEIVAAFPGTDRVFREYGIQVDGYRALEHESLSATARVHQWNVEEVLAALKKQIQQ